MTTCKICGKSYKRLSAHVKAHGITWRQYLEQYEPLQAEIETLTDILDDLYIAVRSKILTQTKQGYFTTDITSPLSRRKYPLGRSDLRRHLEGKHTLGTYFPEYTSKVLGLDIDLPKSDSKARMALRVLYHSVTNYLPSDSLIMSHSGNKGYHLDIFFSEPVKKDKLQMFYEMILQEINYTTSEIEARGTGEQGYKLPLGYHQQTGAYCYLTDQDGDQIPREDEISTLKSVRKADPALIDEAIKDIKVNRQIKKEEEIILTEIKPLEVYSDPSGLIRKIERDGITKPNTRHNQARTLAHLYKMQGHSQAQIEDKLLTWHRSLDKRFYTSTQAQIAKDCKELAANAMTYNGFKYLSRRPVITKSEVMQALELKGKPLRRLYYALLIHAKTFADKETGIFYMTYKQIGEALNGARATVDRGHFRNQLHKLEQAGLLEVVRSNKPDPTTRNKSLPNQYRLINVNLDALPTEGFTICDKVCPCTFCFDVALRNLLTERELRQYFPRTKVREEIETVLCELS